MSPMPRDMDWRKIIWEIPVLRIRSVAESSDKLMDWIGRLLCRFGFHDYRLMEMVSGFGVGGHVQKVECRRCGYTTTRPG